MEESRRTFIAEMEKILEQCRNIHKEIIKHQTAQDRLLDELDQHILPKFKAVESDHGSR